MSDPSSIDSAFAARAAGRPEAADARAGRARPAADASAPGRAAAREPDRAELSPAAQWLRQAGELPAVRQELVDAMRQRIASGELDTPQRLDAALEAMLDEEAKFPG